MPEIDGFHYDEVDCDLFCMHVDEIVRQVAKMRACRGDAYISHYLDHLAEMIDRRSGGRP